MAKVIKIKPIPVSPGILNSLERRKLIKTLRPPANLLRLKGKNRCEVKKIYSTAPRFGTHKLICVALNTTAIKLNSHPENEEFIIINGAKKKFKDLYLVIGLYKSAKLEQRAKSGKITGKDIMILKLKYNDPATCIFTMLKDTPHCEITSARNDRNAGKGIPPVFFVTEPDKITMKILNLSGYKFAPLV